MHHGDQQLLVSPTVAFSQATSSRVICRGSGTVKTDTYCRTSKAGQSQSTRKLRLGPRRLLPQSDKGPRRTSSPSYPAVPSHRPGFERSLNSATICPSLLRLSWCPFCTSASGWPLWRYSLFRREISFTSALNCATRRRKESSATPRIPLVTISIMPKSPPLREGGLWSGESPPFTCGAATSRFSALGPATCSVTWNGSLSLNFLARHCQNRQRGQLTVAVQRGQGMQL